jgi:molybdenum cofactor cytidylyltransferase
MENSLIQKPDIVILAAGFSSRMGESKTEIRINRKTILETVIENVSDFCENIIVVTGHYHNSQKKILARSKRVTLVYNNEYQLGMFSSVKTGIKYVKTSRFFVLPADIPFIQSSTFRFMIAKSEKILIPVYKGRKGHPVLINSKLIPKILSESDNSNLRDFINKTGFSIVNIDDENILKDLDYIEDVEEFIKE